MKTLSSRERNQLEGLKTRYRTAFRQWIWARNGMTEPYRGAADESDAQANEAAAAHAYRSARNELTDEMTRLAVASYAGGAKVTKIGGRGWGWDFGQILVWIAVAVGVGKVLADLATSAK